MHIQNIIDGMKIDAAVLTASLPPPLDDRERRLQDDVKAQDILRSSMRHAGVPENAVRSAVEQMIVRQGARAAADGALDRAMKGARR